MINLEFDNAVVMRQKAALESMLVSNPDTAANIRKLITQEIAKARAAISQSAKGEMASDPRQAYKAVRRSVYKSILGGQVNIFNPRGGASSSGDSLPQPGGVFLPPEALAAVKYLIRIKIPDLRNHKALI